MSTRAQPCDGDNQPRPLVDYNAWSLDQPLREAVAREGGAAAAAELEGVGRWCGSAEALDDARLANQHPPVLRALDAGGRRLDRVEFHPAWHRLMAASARHGLHGRLWEPLAAGVGRPAATAVTRAAAFLMTAGVECGHLCPLTMTSASVRVLEQAPDLMGIWLPLITTRRYDQRHLPATSKSGVTLGMGMTERSGGSDLSGIETVAEPLASVGRDAYAICGHKWFLSAPMSDAFVVLARTLGGATAFLVPRILADGMPNGLHFVRLKDKLGNRSNASAEVAFDRTVGWRIGEEGRGLAVMLEMVTETRLDCALASVGIMRAALLTALDHARQRRIRGRPLLREPLMERVLADLALDVEAGVALVMHLAGAFDRADDALGDAWRRVMTPVVKYWATKAAPAFVAEAMECLGGNGYVEDSGLPRLYREAPVNAIWEGSGNIMALDVIRVLRRSPAAVGLVLDDLRSRSAGEPLIAGAIDQLQQRMEDAAAIEAHARALAEGLAQVATAAILRAGSPTAVADAWIESRLGRRFRHTYGQELERADTRSIVDRACPF